MKKRTKVVISIIVVLAIAGLVFYSQQPFAIFGGAQHSGRIYNGLGQGSFDLLPEAGQTVERGRLFFVTLKLDCSNCGGNPIPRLDNPILALKDEMGRKIAQTEFNKGDDRQAQENQVAYWQFPQFNTSILSAGEHILYVEYEQPTLTSGAASGSTLNPDDLINIISATDYRSVPKAGQNPIAYIRIFIEPAICDIGVGNAEVSRVVTSGKTFSPSSFTDYPVVKVCDTATRVLRSDLLISFDDYKITTEFAQGQSQTVPPSQVWEIKYIAKKTWQEECTTNTPYSADMKQCAGTGFIRPCGETAVLTKSGTCLEITTQQCTAGTIYNASVSQVGCGIDLAPKGDGWSSQWESSIQAFAIRKPLDQVCETVGGTYQPPKTPEEDGMCLTPDGQLKPPQYSCDAYLNSFPAEKDGIFYCQFGAEQIPDCPEGTTRSGGTCLAKELLIVDKVIVDEKIITRDVPFEVIVEKQIGVPFKYVAVILSIAGIIIVALLYVFWRRK